MSQMRRRTVKAMKTGNAKQGRARIEPTGGAKLRYWSGGTGDVTHSILT